MTVALDRQTWLEQRREGIGASEVAALGCVEGAYGSPWSVWADKVGLTPLDSEPSSAMQLGRDLEPILAVWFHRHTGLYIAGEQTLVRHRREPRWFATVDGFVLDHEGSSIDDALGVIETKYTHEAPWDELPIRHVWQVQWQLACSGLPAGWLAALHLPYGRPDFRVYEVARDDGLIAHQLAVVEDFWNHHVVTGIPPFVDDSKATAKAIDAAWGSLATTQVPLVDLDGHRAEIAELQQATRNRDAAVRAFEHAQHRVKELFGLSGDDEPVPSEGVIGGRLAVSWRWQPGGVGIDAEAVRAEHGDRYDKARKSSRVLRLHGEWRAA